jgi:hypothetical protein
MLGAEVHAVPAVAFENPKNYNHQAREYADQLENAVWTDQFDNTANARVHYETTGPEIWEQTGGELDGFICATGTGGTLAGTGRYLHEQSGGKTQIWLADPPGSVLHSYLSSGGKLNERSGSSITEGGCIVPNLSLNVTNATDRYRPGPCHEEPWHLCRQDLGLSQHTRRKESNDGLRAARYNRSLPWRQLVSQRCSRRGDGTKARSGSVRLSPA